MSDQPEPARERLRLAHERVTHEAGVQDDVPPPYRVFVTRDELDVLLAAAERLLAMKAASDEASDDWRDKGRAW